MRLMILLLLLLLERVFVFMQSFYLSILKLVFLQLSLPPSLSLSLNIPFLILLIKIILQSLFTVNIRNDLSLLVVSTDSINNKFNILNEKSKLFHLSKILNFKHKIQ